MPPTEFLAPSLGVFRLSLPFFRRLPLPIGRWASKCDFTLSTDGGQVWLHGCCECNAPGGAGAFFQVSFYSLGRPCHGGALRKVLRLRQSMISCVLSMILNTIEV